MSQHKDFKYYVIELSNPPYTDPDRYVCVPESWVMVRNTGDSNAVVKFPTEELSETKKRVQREEEFSNNWMIFFAGIKCATNSYADAMNFIETLEKTPFPRQNRMEIFPEDVPSTAGMGNMLESMSLETNEVHSLESSCMEPAGNQNTPERVPLTNPQVELHKANTKVVEKTNFISKPKKYWVRRSLNEPSPPNTFSSINHKLREEFMEIISDDGSCDEVIDEVQQNQENASNVKTPLEQSDRLILLLRVLSDENFKGGLKSLCSEWEILSSMFEKMRVHFIKNFAALKQLIDYTEQLSKSEYSTVATEEIENSLIEKEEAKTNVVNNIATIPEEQNKSRRESEGSSDDTNRTEESEDEEHRSPRPEIRDATRKFILPPEYDRDNSEWTLRYRTKKKGLVEIAPHSEVYVNAIKLNYCKVVAKNSQTLARMLLVEVFSQNALSTCSITGRQSHIFDPKGTNVRPGLDKHAMTVLLSYVFQYARDKKWLYSEITVMNSLRCKLTEIRAKYG